LENKVFLVLVDLRITCKSPSKILKATKSSKLARAATGVQRVMMDDSNIEIPKTSLKPTLLASQAPGTLLTM